MRLGFVILAFFALAGFCAAAYADPANVEPKPWRYGDLGQIRDTYPEQEPNNSCPGQAYAIGDVVTPANLEYADRDWYRFAGTAGQVVTIGTDVVNNGDATDTYLELYFECGGSRIAYDDDSGPGYYSLISNFTLPQTGNYDILVKGYNDSSTGPYKLFSSTPPPPAENDVCSGAIPIECGAGSLQGDNTNYRNDYDPGSGGCASGYPEAGKDAVYVLNLGVGDVVDLVYTQFSFDTAFYIVTDCSNVPGSCVIGADDTLTGEPETIHYVVPAAGAYYVILDAYGANNGGPWSMDYNIQCQGPASGACCLPGEVCIVTTPDDCRAQGGEYQGDNTDCDPNPCEVIATEQSTWGQIKAQYR